MKPDELVDLVDKDGNVRMPGVRRIDVKNRKEELLSKGLYQPIVIVVVFDGEGQVIAQVRGDAKADDDGGSFDHVCGVIASGETWQVAAAREAAEEIGVELDGLCLVDQRVNVYGRYRTLASACAVGEPKALDPAEVSCVLTVSPDDLYAMERQGGGFVKGYFTDLELVLGHSLQSAGSVITP
jgi:8-oxo-dGTP pyrophosphatase MutT (NUDIX family)